MPGGGIPLSELIARFVREAQGASLDQRKAKTDTLTALDRKDFLARNPFYKTDPRGITPRTSLVRNGVVMTPEDQADRTRLAGELPGLTLGEVLASMGRPRPRQ